MRFDQQAFRRGVNDVMTLRHFRDGLFWFRWHLGSRLLVAAAWHIIPPCAARSDLCGHINTWAREKGQQIRDAKQRELSDEVKRTTESWQA
jgi:hypothetical protein